MTITADERKRLLQEKDALQAEVAAIRAEASLLKSQGAASQTAEEKDRITNRQQELTSRVKSIVARLNEINALLAQDTFPPEQGPQYTVTNYVTNQVLQTTTPPNYGDPNASIQKEVNTAYNTPPASSGSVSAPSVSTVATPAAVVISAAQSSPGVSPQQVQQLTTALGGLNQVGQVPIMLSDMINHAKTVLDQPTRVFDAIDLTFRPDEAGTVGRCQSLSGFIGSIQGIYNGTLNAITSGLNTITSALVAVPTAIIAGFTAATTALLTAITSGVQQAISTAISAVTSVSNSLLGALGETVQGIVSTVGTAVSGVSSAIQAEIQNVSQAINSLLNNPFRLIVPSVNPCVAGIYKSSNPSANNWQYLTPTGQGLSMSNSDVIPASLTPDQIELRRLSSEISRQVALL